MTPTPPEQLLVRTVGHSSRSLAEVVALLRVNQADLLVDVRSFPGSRAHPQWGREHLEAHLPADIGYEWLPALGGRRHTPVGVASPNGGWRVAGFRAYADYMATDEFRAGLERIVALAEAHRPAIMCSEAVPWRCHRRLITDALLVRGIRVAHIMSATSVRPGTLTEFARVDGTTITYPPPGITDSS